MGTEPSASSCSWLGGFGGVTGQFGTADGSWACASDACCFDGFFTQVACRRLPAVFRRARCGRGRCPRTLGPFAGRGQWRLGIAEADLFEGARQPRRAHNTWLEWGTLSVGSVGVCCSCLRCCILGSPHLLSSFSCGFQRKPDFMLLMALLTTKACCEGVQARSGVGAQWVRPGRVRLPRCSV